MFSTGSENCIPICQYYDITCISLLTAELEEPKIGMWGIGLTPYPEDEVRLAQTGSLWRFEFSSKKIL